jgi:hypothetical protein
MPRIVQAMMPKIAEWSYRTWEGKTRKTEGEKDSPLATWLESLIPEGRFLVK